MARQRSTRAELESEVDALRDRLDQAEQTLRAFQSGQVDAFFVSDDSGVRVLALEGAESSYRVLVEAMSEGAAVLEARGTILYCNARMATLLSGRLEAVMGRALVGFVGPADRGALEALLVRGTEAACGAELTLQGPDGTTTAVQLSLSPMQVHGRAGICAVATDLTERKRAEEQVRSLSLVDELTGLANRRGFLTLAGQQLKLAHRLAGRMVILFADLDGLKPINDTLGHQEGDRALQDTAAVMRSMFREGDILARLGGDEFAILATVATEGDAATLIARLHASLEAHNTSSVRGYRLALSVGAAVNDPAAPRSVEALLQEADAAMYCQKRLHQQAARETVRLAS